MCVSFKVMSLGKGRQEFGPDLKQAGHRLGNIARGKNDASPGLMDAPFGCGGDRTPSLVLSLIAMNIVLA